MLRIEYLILFKIKAWLNLTEGRRQGEAVSERTINKHKNDIFRLLVNVQPGMFVTIEMKIYADVMMFIDLLTEADVDLGNLGIREIPFVRFIEQIRRMYHFD